MSKHRKFYIRLMSGKADANINFIELCQLLISLGFEERIRGDHHIFSKSDIAEILNLQPNGAEAKPYQVKQIRSVIRAYGLDIED